MANIANLKNNYFFIILLTLALGACGGGSSDGDDKKDPITNIDDTPDLIIPSEPTIPNVTTGTISGNVLNFTTGEPVPGISVSIGDKIATTGTDGRYSISDVPLNSTVPTEITGDDFVGQRKLVIVTEENKERNLSISLMPIDTTETFDSSIDESTDQTFTDTDSPARVVLSANSLAQQNGSAPVGDITINMTAIDPTRDIDLLPGDSLTDVAGLLKPIESFGALAVTFYDSEKNKLDLIPGATASIRIPVANRAANTPANIPLYYDDRATGRWIQDGSAQLVSAGTESYYEGTVSHFTTWNAADLFAPIAISGCVEDSNGALVSGVNIRAEGDDYSALATTTSDSAGNFSLPVKPDTSIFILGLTENNHTNTLKVSTGKADKALPSCLTLSTITGRNIDVSVSLKLTWGLTPNDLDSHLVGANYHVYYEEKGSLTSPPFAKLDVDDLVSFGPEVITIFSFPGVGKYQYSVHNFFKDEDVIFPRMTGTDARVELNFNGNISIFTPPEGEEANNTWHVLEFVVDQNRRVTVNTINSWSADTPE